MTLRLAVPSTPSRFFSVQCVFIPRHFSFSDSAQKGGHQHWFFGHDADFAAVTYEFIGFGIFVPCRSGAALTLGGEGRGTDGARIRSLIPLNGRAPWTHPPSPVDSPSVANRLHGSCVDNHCEQAARELRCRVDTAGVRADELLRRATAARARFRQLAREAHLALEVPVRAAGPCEQARTRSHMHESP